MVSMNRSAVTIAEAASSGNRIDSGADAVIGDGFELIALLQKGEEIAADPCLLSCQSVELAFDAAMRFGRLAGALENVCLGAW